jgi:hypothetical protein
MEMEEMTTTKNTYEEINCMFCGKQIEYLMDANRLPGGKWAHRVCEKGAQAQAEQVQAQALQAQEEQKVAQHSLSKRLFGCPPGPIKAVQDIALPPRYQDINFSFSRRIATAHLEGHVKYEKAKIDSGAMQPIDKNYHHADLAFALGRLGNLIKHAQLLYAYYEHVLGGIPLPKDFAFEDHLGHVGANANMLAKWEQMGVLPDSEEPKKKDG